MAGRTEARRPLSFLAAVPQLLFLLRPAGLSVAGLAAMALTACGPGGGPDRVSVDAPAPGADGAGRETSDMRLVAHHDLQGRSAYQPVVYDYGDRRILFVGHHAGEAVNPLTGVTETNGLSVLDVTDPASPRLLTHVPPSGADASGTQHVQVCSGGELPAADPGKVYLVRTNGLLSYELFDVTDPAAPAFMATLAETGTSSRPESNRGNRETHKLQWECSSGLGFFNGTADGWRVTRVLQLFDLSNPDAPRHIRDFGLSGWEPGAPGPWPKPAISGLHQAYAHGDYVYLGYGSGNDGVLQIVDRDKLVGGNPEADAPFAPTPANLAFPEVGRLDMPDYWGVHTAKPVIGLEVPGYRGAGSVRDFLIVPSEAGPGSMLCGAVRDVVFLVDVTQPDKPYPVSSFQVPAAPGGYCDRGGRFGPHSVHDALHPGFDRSLMVLSYFNAGIRVVDIRNPFEPEEVAYFVPAVTDKTSESCITVGDTRTCRRAVQTNNVNIDDRGYVYAVDRANSGLHIVELTGAARRIAGL